MIIIFLTLVKLHAASLFLPDSDTAALILLVSNTASTVVNTMQILEVAKETSKKIDKYNFMAMRKYFIARRIEQHARDIADIKRMKPNGLAELNRVLMRLKINLKGLKSSMNFLAKDVFAVEDFTAKYWEKVANAMADEKETHNQAILSASSDANPAQNTAMNTALNGKILSKMRRDNLEYQKIHLEMKKGHTVSKLREEQHYRDWAGINETAKRTR